MSVHKEINIEFFKVWTPNMAYILGFFAADGNLSLNKRGGCYISFDSKDRQIILDVRNAIGSRNKISKRFNKTTRHIFFRLQIGSKDIFHIFQDRKSTRLNSSHIQKSRMPSSA